MSSIPISLRALVGLPVVALLGTLACGRAEVDDGPELPFEPVTQVAGPGEVLVWVLDSAGGG